MYIKNFKFTRALRVICVILALSFALCIVGCSKNDKESDGEHILSYEDLDISTAVRLGQYKGLTVTVREGESAAQAIWRVISDTSEILEYPEKQVDYYLAQSRTRAEYYSSVYKVSYEEAIAALGYTEDSILGEAKALVASDLLGIAVRKSEGISLTDDEKSRLLEEEISKKGFFYPYKLLFSEPKVIIFCIISAIAGIGRYGLLTWVPTYFTEELGLSLKNDMFTYIVLPLGQACAMFVFPFITDKIFKGKREPMIVLASIIAFLGLITFPFFTTQLPATIMLFVVGVFSMVTGVIWAIAGDIGGKAMSATVVGVFDWAVYMGAAIQALVFGFVKESFGWSAIFITIGCLYVVLLALTFIARKIKLKKL
jgi:hypothetical protein